MLKFIECQLCLKLSWHNIHVPREGEDRGKTGKKEGRGGRNKTEGKVREGWGRKGSEQREGKGKENGREEEKVLR